MAGRSLNEKKTTSGKMAADAVPAGPRHVAIIMDGNGRWAQRRGVPRLKGHEEGAQSILSALKCCEKAGVHYLTLYAFSTENWNRSADEVQGLMELMVQALKKHAGDLHKQQIRLRAMGQLDRLPERSRNELFKVMEATRSHDQGQLILALSYGGRAELVEAARVIAREVRDGRLDPERITEETVAAHLYLPDVPDPDLLIRTSGEMRLSNFMLWQLSYAEIYVTETLWPDFREAEFMRALEAYRARDRRFGGRVEQKGVEHAGG
jgi:undecaprenyl diphosphate synthase